MPGLVAFRRRWSVGSDDLVVPGIFLFIMHFVWGLVLTLLLIFVHFDKKTECILLLWGFIIGYLVILILSMILDLTVANIALRGTTLKPEPRESMEVVLYFRLAVMLIEAGWLGAGVYWLAKYYKTCPIEKAKETVLGLVICNWCLLLSVLMTVWCTYDAAGRSWVKMKRYQQSMKATGSKYLYKRSNSARNWRQRKVLRAYQDRWQQRCKFLFCCYSGSDRNRNSFADIAKLLSDFFRDLDVVPSDVIVGLVLLRKYQKLERKNIIEQKLNDTYEYLSGVPVTPRTQFLSLHEGGQDLELFQSVIHYAHFAVHAYGWPMYIYNNKFGFYKVCSNLTCCCFPCRKNPEGIIDPEIINDNCCKCNYAVLKKLCDVGDIEIVYATYHCDIGETPFFIALDYDRKKVIISIRGTLSMQDILTDLNAEGETIPLDPIKEDWLGHKGMVLAAQYIYNHLEKEKLIELALQYNLERETDTFQLVIVGHSLGAGTASILGILLRQHYRNLECYCYAPPGGLLSMPAVEYSKEFTISVVVGKDVVPRIGLHQMEAFRSDLITAIQRSEDPKWKTITCSMICCGCVQPTSVVEMNRDDTTAVDEYSQKKQRARKESLHPSDSSIALTCHHPLYPPGRIIHVVRHHPTKGEQALSKRQPVYQALWAENVDFDEVIISPVMIQDHMPDILLSALKKVVTTLGPRKPQRISNLTSANGGTNELTTLSNSESSPRTRFCLETSFTSLQSSTIPTLGGPIPSTASSVTNGYHSAKSHHSPIQINHVLTMFGNDKVSDFEINLTQPKYPKSLSLNIKATSPTIKYDLIHDDWFGLAPLASPESLSEISVISSRASLLNSCEKLNSSNVSANNTPKLMKRTLKIVGNLSTCADDIINVRNFQKVKTFTRKKSLTGSHSTNTDSSFESAINEEIPQLSRDSILQIPEKVPDKISTSSEIDDFQSAEDILDNVMISAGCKEFFNSTPSFLETHFDFFEGEKQEDSPKLCRLVYQSSPTLLSPNSPEDIDQDILSNLAIDLNLQETHRSMQIYSSKSNSVDSGSTCRTTPSDCKNVTFNPQVVNIEHIPISPRKKDKWQFFRSKSNPTKINVEVTVNKSRLIEPPKTILCNKRRNSDEDFFARTEALPLLSGLTGSLSDTPPGYVRRKNHVYPSDIAVLNKPNESSV